MNNGKGQRNRFTAQEKLEILKQGEQPGVSVAELCRKRALAPSVYYRWRMLADQAMQAVLKGEGRAAQGGDEEAQTLP